MKKLRTSPDIQMSPRWVPLLKRHSLTCIVPHYYGFANAWDQHSDKTNLQIIWRNLFFRNFAEIRFFFFRFSFILILSAAFFKIFLQIPADGPIAFRFSTDFLVGWTQSFTQREYILNKCVHHDLINNLVQKKL